MVSGRTGLPKHDVLRPPGYAGWIYPLRAGVWLPWPGKRLQASTTDLPVVRRAVAIGHVTVIRR
jgi:hypothetical protein